MKNVLAIDFGESSGRAVIGSFDGTVIKLTEIHRFSNDPVILGKTMYWDFLRLFHEIKQSLIKSKEYGEIDSIAIDTWGVDFGLIDKSGRMLENPVHYRDNRTAGTSDYSKRFIDHNRLYEKTGIQIMEINTAFQLLSIIRDRSELLDRADKMLMMPDLFAYYLGAKPVAEMSIASTTQLFDANTKTWSEECCERLKIKHSLLPEIVAGGTVVGTLSDEICKELDIKPAKIIAACGHDTQSAMVAVPAVEKDFAFLSCGTWSLLGTELDAPVINEKSAKLNVSNETGYGAKTSFLKNIIGLWLIQECRRDWQKAGQNLSWNDIVEEAKKAEPFRSIIDPDYGEFFAGGRMVEKIQTFCRETNQAVPETVGQIARCIYESLALKYRWALERLEEIKGQRIDTLNIVGGGCQNKLLNQFVADSIDRPVITGPIEGAAIGNLLAQAMALGDITTMDELRTVVRRSEAVSTYEPHHTPEWEAAYQKLLSFSK